MIRILSIAALLCCSTAALAQDADNPAPKKKPGKAAAEVRITDPAVLTILESKPSTPAEQFQAARLLAELGHANLARPLLKKVIDANLDDAALAGLVEKFGSHVFLQFSKIESMAPEAGEFVSAALAAASRVARDPKRLSVMVSQLVDGDVVKRQDAMVGLMRAGDAAIGPLFAAYIDPTREREAAAAGQMLMRMNADAVGPLLGVFRGGSFDQQAAAADFLARLGATEALPAIMAFRFLPHVDGAKLDMVDAAIEKLGGRVPSDQVASDYLKNEARTQLEVARRIDAQDNFGIAAPTAELWHWDSKRNEAIRATETAANVARANSLRAATTLRAMKLERTPAEQAEVDELYWMARLETSPPSNSDRTAEPISADDVSRLAELVPKTLASGHEAAAIGALELLGESGSPDLLLASHGRRSPMVEAARSGDRRVRFAAIEAILKLKPTTPFAGSSTVSEGLQYFANGTGQKRAVVAHPKSRIAQQIAGYLNPLGYEVEIATNGREAFRLATQTPDVELAIIHSAIDHVRADDLLAQLRKDPRTARLPVIVLAVPDYTRPAERLARGDTYSQAFAEPQDAAAMKFQIDRLLSMPGCAPVDPKVRQAQATKAIAALTQFADQPVAWLDARGLSTAIEHSLYKPAMTGPVATLLGSAGTATGQSELVQLAGRDSLPLAKREAAALAFARSVAKHGILLTSEQILHQYDRYNDNAGRNKDTHKVMQIVLDAIESKSRDTRIESDESVRDPAPVPANS